TKGSVRDVENYTDYNLPTTIVMNGQLASSSSFAYNAFGQRVAKFTPTGKTIYLGRLFESREDSDKGTYVFHVSGPDGVIAQISQSDAESPQVVDYLQNDALGSVFAVVQTTGPIAERLYFEPFGKRINPDGSEYHGVGQLKDGFTGHEHDYEFGLINM